MRSTPTLVFTAFALAASPAAAQPGALPQAPAVTPTPPAAAVPMVPFRQPPPSSAVAVASLAGEIVGAAFICGIDPGRTAEVGRGAIAYFKGLATDAADQGRAEVAYGEAVQRAAGTQIAGGAGAADCAAVSAAFEGLDRRIRQANGG